MKYKFYFIISICWIYTCAQTKAQNIETYTRKGGVKEFFNGFRQGDPFKISGSVGLNLRSYSASGIPNRQTPFVWFLSGQTNIQIYKLNIPISVLASAQNLTYSHPFHKEAYVNRFTRIGASPYYKWIKLHIGHRAMNFSPLTVANHTFLGGGIELTPGLFRFAAFGGRLARTEPQDLSLYHPNQVVFNRKGWGMKVGYGNQQHFLDLIVFKAKDAPYGDIPVNRDTTKIFQKENLVTALNGQTMLMKHLRLNLELASSAFTLNAADPVLSGARITSPEFLIKKRTSTNYRYAMNSNLLYQFKVFTLGLGYRRVEPDYRSLGAYFFNDDLENLTANTGFGLWKNSLHVNGSIGRQRNNLRASKSTQFNRTIGSLDINYTHKNFNAGFNYSNYSSTIKYVLNLNQDSLNAVIVTNQGALNASYTQISDNKDRHIFSGAFSAEGISDNVADINSSAASQMQNGMIGYVFSREKNGLNINASLNYNKNELSNVLIHRYGFSGGFQKDIIPKKWSFGMGINYFSTRGVGVSNRTLNLRLSSPWKIAKHHNLDFSFLYLFRFKTNNASLPKFNEVTGTLNYIFTF